MYRRTKNIQLAKRRAKQKNQMEKISLKIVKKQKKKLIKCIFFLNLQNQKLRNSTLQCAILDITVVITPWSFEPNYDEWFFCDGRAVVGGIGYSRSLICVFQNCQILMWSWSMDKNMKIPQEKFSNIYAETAA